MLSNITTKFKKKCCAKLTKEQAIVVMGYTGITTCSFSDFHADVEKRLGHPVWIHEFATEEFTKKLRKIYYEDFINMCSI